MKLTIKIIIVISLSFFYVLGNSIEPGEKDNKEKYFELAINCLNNNDAKNAEHYLSKVIESYESIKKSNIEDYINVYGLRASVRMELNMTDLAISDYETFITYKNNQLVPYLDLQILYLKSNDINKAKKISEKAILLFPSEFRLRFNVLQNECFSGQFNEVIIECLKILDDPYYINLPKEKLECPPFEELIGYSYLQIGDIEKAKYYAKILKEKYNNPLSSIDLIRLLYIAENNHIKDNEITEKMLNDYINEM